MKQVEFFGLSNSGKTFYKNKLKSNLEERRLTALSYKDIIFNFLPYEEKNLSKRLILKLYFFYKKTKKEVILKKNQKKYSFSSYKKTDFKRELLKIYYDKIEEIYNLCKKKDIKFVSLVEKLILESNFKINDKKIIFRWFKEELIAKYLIRKYKKKIDFVLDSEGFLQRLNIYSYKKRNKSKIISNYLRLCPLPNFVIFTEKKIVKKKSYLNNLLDLEINEQKKVYDIVIKKISLKNLKIKIINMENFKAIFNSI